MKFDDPRHGTYAGYQRHRNDGEQACGPCREAGAAYMREYRAVSVNRMELRRQSRATARALWRLVDLHRDEYEHLRGEELAAQRGRAAS